eukprot:gene4648-3350_t
MHPSVWRAEMTQITVASQVTRPPAKQSFVFVLIDVRKVQMKRNFDVGKIERMKAVISVVSELAELAVVQKDLRRVFSAVWPTLIISKEEWPHQKRNSLDCGGGVFLLLI